MTEGLTKENFFNEMWEKYHGSTKEFCNWVDGYKKAVSWNHLFNGGVYGTVAPKFNEIPFALQFGILYLFFKEYNITIQPNRIAIALAFKTLNEIL